MKGDPRVLDLLNEILTGELTAINQYFLHARILGSWGFERMAKFEYDESIEEMKHAQALIDRVLFLDGLPNLQRLGKLNVGTTVLEILKNDLALESTAIPLLNKSIETCRQIGDSTSEHLLIDILAAEEDHVDWLETQLELIKQIGEAHYLAQHIHG